MQETKKEIKPEKLGKVVLLLGGMSSEREVSLMSGKGVFDALTEAGVDVTTIRFNGVIHDWGMLNGFATLPPTRSLILFSAAMLKRYLE